MKSKISCWVIFFSSQMSAWQERILRDYDQGKRVALQKLPLQISRLDVLSSSSFACPTYLLATTQGRLVSSSEIQSHPYSQHESWFFLWSITFFFLIKSNESTFHYGGLKNKYRLEEIFARVKMEQGKRKFPAFPNYTDFFFMLKENTIP